MSSGATSFCGPDFVSIVGLDGNLGVVEKTSQSVEFFSGLRVDLLTTMGHHTVCVEGERMDEPIITVRWGPCF